MEAPWTSVLAAAALLAAGCVAPAEPSPANARGAEALAPTSADADAAALPSGPLALYMTPDLALAPEPPGAEGTVTLPTPLNSPFTGEYPTWAGTLPRAVNLSMAEVQLVFYVTTNTASVAAKSVPAFEVFAGPLPGFFVGLRVGDASLDGEVDGPAFLRAGEVQEVRAVLQGDAGDMLEGAEVALRIMPLYTHVAHAAEFRFVMGPEHPAHVALGGP